MLNPETKQRELAYIVQIDEIKPIPNYDRVEYARTGGWWVIVRKEQFQIGDLAIYFEIDSKTPETEPFKFLEKKHYKIKTQKMCGVISQGLLMSFEDFGWSKDKHQLGDFVTNELGITYSVKEDNKRKGKGIDKYQSMAQRRPDIFKRPWARWMMRRNWGKKIMFIFFGKKKDNDRKFPNKFEYIHKTDQERVENMPWVLETDYKFIRTQKCDGSSATYILERKPRGKFEFYVCSRNVRMLDEKQDNFYSDVMDDNPYWEMAKKYDIENKLKDFLQHWDCVDYVCWQGEICGPKIQGNPHKLKENHLFLFHMITSDLGMWNIIYACNVWTQYKMEHVPIEAATVTLENDMEEFKLTADGYYDPSVCGEGQKCRREGYVYYKIDDPNFSFKNVSRNYLLKKGE